MSVATKERSRSATVLKDILGERATSVLQGARKVTAKIEADPARGQPGHLTEKQFAGMLSARLRGRDLGYDNESSERVSQRIIEALVTPLRELQKTMVKRVGDLDALSVAAMFLRKDLPEELRRTLLGELEEKVGAGGVALRSIRSAEELTEVFNDNSKFTETLGMSPSRQSAHLTIDFTEKQARAGLNNLLNSPRNEERLIGQQIVRELLFTKAYNPYMRRDNLGLRGETGKYRGYEGKTYKVYHVGPQAGKNTGANYIVAPKVENGRKRNIIYVHEIDYEKH